MRVTPEEQQERDKKSLEILLAEASKFQAGKVPPELTKEIEKRSRQAAGERVRPGPNPSVGYLPVSSAEAAVPAAPEDSQKKLDDAIARGRAAGKSDREIFDRLAKSPTYGPLLAGRKAPEPEAPEEEKSFLENVMAGAGGRTKELYQGGKQLLNVGDQEQLQKEIDATKAANEKVGQTWGGMIGGFLPDIAAFALPGGAVARGAMMIPKLAGVARAAPVLTRLVGGAAEGAAQSAFEPVETGSSQESKTIGGAIGGAAGSALQGLIGRVITPLRHTSSSRAKMAQKLLDEDIPLSAGQQTGSPNLQALETAMQSIPLVKGLVHGGNTKQQEAYTRAVAKRLGSASETIDEKALQEADDKIGAAFNAVEKSKSKKLDAKFARDLAAVEQKILSAEASTGVAPGRAAFEAQAARYASGKPISGKEYNLARSHLTKAASKAARSGDVAEAEVLRDLREANDAFAQRRFTGSKELPEAWKQWGVLKDLETPGVLTSEGLVNPQKLKSVVQRKNPVGFAQGGDDYIDLVKSADILKPGGPDSGTARNLLIAKMLMNPATLVAGGAGGTLYGIQNPEHGMAGLGALGGALALTQTKTGRKYLANKLLNEGMPKKAADLLRYAGPSIGADIGADWE